MQPAPAGLAAWGWQPPYRVPDGECSEGRGYWVRAPRAMTIWSAD